MILRVRGAAAPVMLAVAMAVCSCVFPEHDPELFNDDGWIAREGDTYSYVHRTMRGSGSGLELAFSGFYGKHSLWSIESSSEASISVATTVGGGLRGLFKVCLISPDKTVRVLATGAGSSSQAIELQDGTSGIAVIGYGATGTASIRLDRGQSSAAVVIRDIR